MEGFENLNVSEELTVCKSVEYISEEKLAYENMKYCSTVWFLVILCCVFCHGFSLFDGSKKGKIYHLFFR